MTDEASQPIRRRVDQAIEQAAAEGVFDDLEGAGRPLEMHDSMVPDEFRVPLKVLENTGMAPDWVESAREIEQRVDSLRAARQAHAQRMHTAREHALAGSSADLADRFRAAGRNHATVRATLGAAVQAISRPIERLSTIAPAGAPRPSSLPRVELDTIDAIGPWPPQANESA